MSDDTTRFALDCQLISLQEDQELRDGCRRPGCTREQRRAEVKAASSSADAVRQHLSRK